MKVRSMRERCRDQQGYTLTELLVALGITALVAALAVSTLVFFNRINQQIADPKRSTFEQE